MNDRAFAEIVRQEADQLYSELLKAMPLRVAVLVEPDDGRLLSVRSALHSARRWMELYQQEGSP